MPAQIEPSGKNWSLKSALFLPEYKIGFLSVYGSTGLLTYFLALYLKELGFSPRQIGVVNFTHCLGGLLGGFLISKFTNTFSNQQHVVTKMMILSLVIILPIGLLGPATESECRGDSTSGHGEELLASDRSWMFLTDDVVVAFIISNILVFMSEMVWCCVNTALHGGTMLQLGEHDTKSFGHVRAWGAIGELVSFLIFGIATSRTVTRRKICGHVFIEADYHFLLYIIAGFSLIGAVNGQYIYIKPQFFKKEAIEAPSDNQTPQELCTLKHITWLIVQFSRSIFFSAAHGFLNWHIENLGASPMVIGGLNMVVVFAQTIAFFSTRQLIRLFGHSYIIYADLLLHIARLTAYAMISDFLYLIPFLIIEGLMFASAWSATASYLSNQVTEERQTEVQGVLQTVHTSGKAAGYLLGGVLTQAMGAPAMFLIFAGVAASILIMFFIVQKT